MPGPFKIISGGLLIRCRVTPSGSTDKILGLEADAAGKVHLKIKVSSAPEKGKANQAVVKLLAKSLGLPKSSIEVISGPTSRLKMIRISGDGGTILAWAKALAEGE